MDKALWILPTNISMNFDSINKILQNLQLALGDGSRDHVVLDLSATTWFSAEMTTFVAVLVRQLQESGYTVSLNSNNVKNKIWTILNKNGFLEHFGLDHGSTDWYDTTIQFVELPSRGTREIDDYLTHKVFSKMDTKITEVQNEIIKSAIYEVTHNIVEHSKADSFFMCGQYFPTSNKLTFSIADGGISIPTNIQSKLPLKYDEDFKYIDWATQEGSSTKKNAASGIGLFEIRENMKQLGEFKILSRNGLNSYGLYTPLLETLPTLFQGTMIYLEYDLSAQLKNLNPQTETFDFIF